MKMINKDPFSNGTEFMLFTDYNCDRCAMNSEYDEEIDSYTNADDGNMPLCPILRDFLIRMFSDEPISEESLKVADDFIFHGTLCPKLQLKPQDNAKTNN